MESASDEPVTRNEPTHDQIAERAFTHFLARGATHGQDVDDWLCAERELRAGESKDDPKV